MKKLPQSKKRGSAIPLAMVVVMILLAMGTGYRLFVTQCFYRVHVRGLPSWIDSEHNPHAEGNDQ